MKWHHRSRSLFSMESHYVQCRPMWTEGVQGPHNLDHEFKKCSTQKHQRFNEQVHIQSQGRLFPRKTLFYTLKWVRLNDEERGGGGCGGWHCHGLHERMMKKKEEEEEEDGGKEPSKRPKTARKGITLCMRKKDCGDDERTFIHIVHIRWRQATWRLEQQSFFASLNAQFWSCYLWTSFILRLSSISTSYMLPKWWCTSLRLRKRQFWSEGCRNME